MTSTEPYLPGQLWV